jgi:hypothetical protein
MAAAKGKQAKSPHVPAHYFGYSLQAQRMLVRLLNAEDDTVVSLEVFEDVGVENSSGNRIAEQSKSTLDGNPVADRAKDLWKTFSNWVDSVKSNELELGKTRFVIYVSRQKTGCIVESFHKASTDAEARHALANAKVELFTPSAQSTDISDTIKPFVENVFGADESLVTQIITKFTLECGSGDSQDDLRKQMGKVAPPEILDDVLSNALGWVKKQTDSLIEKGKPANIDTKDFRTNLFSFIRMADRRTFLKSFAHPPSQEEIAADLKVRTYVRQLDIIDCDDDQKIRAVTDFLRASFDRVKWSEKGWVHEESFDDFQNGLVRTWDNLKRKIKLSQPTLVDEEKGQMLYVECSQHQATLQGIETPEYFTPGSFHRLADGPLIGWHPNYEQTLKKVDGEDSQ